MESTATAQHGPGAPAVESDQRLELGRGYQRSFAQIPEELIMDHRVSPLAMRLWCVLDRKAKGRPVAMDSLTKLAGKLRGKDGAPCSISTVQRAIRDLDAADWLDVHHVDGKTSRYVLHREQPPAPSTTPVSGDRTPDGGPVSDDRPPRSPLTGHTRAIPSPREEVKGEAPPPPPAPTAKPPTYVGRCAKHGDHPNPPDCRPCGAARITHQATQAAAAAAQPDLVKCPAHLILHAPNAECRSCRADRLAGDGQPGLARATA